MESSDSFSHLRLEIPTSVGLLACLRTWPLETRSIVRQTVTSGQINSDVVGRLESLHAQPLHEIDASDDDNGVAVLADFSICLCIYDRSGNQHAELSVAKPRDESASVPNSDPIDAGLVALSLQRKLDRNRVRSWKHPMVTDHRDSTARPPSLWRNGTS